MPFHQHSLCLENAGKGREIVANDFPYGDKIHTKKRKLITLVNLHWIFNG